MDQETLNEVGQRAVSFLTEHGQQIMDYARENPLAATVGGWVLMGLVVLIARWRGNRSGASLGEAALNLQAALHKSGWKADVNKSAGKEVAGISLRSGSNQVFVTSRGRGQFLVQTIHPSVGSVTESSDVTSMLTRRERKQLRIMRDKVIASLSEQAAAEKVRADREATAKTLAKLQFMVSPKKEVAAPAREEYQYASVRVENPVFTKPAYVPPPAPVAAKECPCGGCQAAQPVAKAPVPAPKPVQAQATLGSNSPEYAKLSKLLASKTAKWRYGKSAGKATGQSIVLVLLGDAKKYVCNFATNKFFVTDTNTDVEKELAFAPAAAQNLLTLRNQVVNRLGTVA